MAADKARDMAEQESRKAITSAVHSRAGVQDEMALVKAGAAAAAAAAAEAERVAKSEAAARAKSRGRMAIFKKGVSKMRISRLVADGAYGAFRLLIVPEAGVHNVKSEHYWYKWAVQAFDDRAWFSSVECHPMPEAWDTTFGDIEATFKELDVDGDGYLTLMELLALSRPPEGATEEEIEEFMPRLSKEVCKELFKESDADGDSDGRMSLEEMEMLNEKLSDRESRWAMHLGRELQANHKTVVLGHGAGAAAALRLLEDGGKLAGAVLVGGARSHMLREMVVPAGRKATFKMLEDAAAQGPEYFLRERNWAAMKEGVGQFGLAIAHSADDPMVTAAEAGATCDRLELKDVDFQELTGARRGGLAGSMHCARGSCIAKIVTAYGRRLAAAYILRRPRSI